MAEVERIRTEASLRAEMEENISTMHRRTEVVEFGGMKVELREMSFHQIAKRTRHLAEYPDTEEGKATLKELRLTPIEYFGFTLTAEIAFFAGTDIRIWPGGESDLPKMLAAPKDELRKLSDAAARVLQLNGPNDDEEEVEAADPDEGDDVAKNS